MEVTTYHCDGTDGRRRLEPNSVKMNDGDGGRGRRPKDRPDGDDDEEDDDVDDGEGLEAWERAYADERSWESLQEDESGMLRPIDSTALQHAQYRRRLRSTASATARIQKGLIRYLYVVIDLSRVIRWSCGPFTTSEFLPRCLRLFFLVCLSFKWDSTHCISRNFQ